MLPQSEASSVRGRITGRTTSSGSKVMGIPQAQRSGFWSGCPPPKAHSQLFELCLSFPAFPSPKEKTQEADGENTHQVLLGGSIYRGR